MKILHTSDWHLGRMLYGRSLLEDQEYFIQKVFLPAVEKSEPDLVILAGDVYDRQIPPVEAIRLFDKTLLALYRQKTTIAVLAGNHDSADRLAIGAAMLRQSGVYIAAHLEDLWQPLVWEKGGERVYVSLLPYCEPAEIRQFLGREDIHGFNGCYAALLEELRRRLPSDGKNILACHCFVSGAQISDSESTLYVGGSGEVSPELFAGFDYVALGHLHAPQRAGENGRYAGSPLKYSFDEEHQRKSMTLLTVEDGRIRREELPVAPLRDMRTLSGTMQDLLQAGKRQVCRDYVALRITDPAPIYMPAEQLRPYYPNLLSVHCDWLDAAAQPEYSELRGQFHRNQIDENEVLRQFMRQVCGQEATDADTALFSELLARQATGEIQNVSGEAER